jgi:hypothetical protein
MSNETGRRIWLPTWRPAAGQAIPIRHSTVCAVAFRGSGFGQ